MSPLHTYYELFQIVRNISCNEVQYDKIDVTFIRKLSVIIIKLQLKKFEFFCFVINIVDYGIMASESIGGMKSLDRKKGTKNKHGSNASPIYAIYIYSYCN